jgi:glyoxylase-like metal-dependent hydrolase (beta-lactamase superfamily II)
MIRNTFIGGPFDTNGYLIADKPAGTALVIDAPEGTAAAMVAKAREWQTPIRYLITTHAHWDHFQDNAALVRLSGAKLGIHRDGERLLATPQPQAFGYNFEIEPCAPAFYLEEDKPLAVGALTFEILHCPGHCPGSVALFERNQRALFVGDILFAGSVGRTDLPGGDWETLRRSITEKLFRLGDDVRVYCGHGPVTTIGQERAHNPFLQ